MSRLTFTVVARLDLMRECEYTANNICAKDVQQI
jgi:hypothetical protein